MPTITKITVSTGIFWIEVPKAGLRMLCGCPADAMKHLLRKGLVVPVEVDGVACETGPNAILLSDLAVQEGRVCNRSEFPVLQMLYKQGFLVPNHPNNTGTKPLLVGSRREVDAQMSYILRGNYGLVSREELIEAGVAPAQADELMRIKLAFAFGRICPTVELIEPVYLEGAPVKVREGVGIQRLRTNVFEISFAGERIEVDLNLRPGESFECPYTLDNHLLEPNYFAVVHTGDGDGWDMNRPTTGSIVMFQGRIYMVDAGPNIEYALTALGIGVNEIDGIFHTHCHDDHLDGLTSLMRRDRRIAYFAAPFVRASVIKKVAAAMQISERELSELLEVHDLRVGEWNDIDSLEVMPVLSPHPVETTIFYFRTMWEGGYRSYGHLADVASSKVLSGMVTSDGSAPGISQAFYENTMKAYREKVDVKKIDIGGGMIHGEAVDFREDPSGTLILAHTARRLTEEERLVGSGAPFGTVHVLIEGSWDVFRRRAFTYLRDYFPDVPLHRVRHLLNCRVQVFNPEAILMKTGQAVREVHLVLSGSVEMLRVGARGGNYLSAGSFIGETPALLDTPSAETYRAVGFTRVLRVPQDLYRDFVIRSGLYRQIVQSHDKREVLRGAWLFGDGVSCVTLNSLIDAAEDHSFSKNEVVAPSAEEIIVLRSGRALLTAPSGYEEHLLPGMHFGGVALAHGAHRGAQVKFFEDTQAYRLPLNVVARLPVVCWKLFETQQRRYG